MARIERGVGRDDDHAGPVGRIVSGLSFAKHSFLIRLQFLPNGNASDGEAAAEIGLHQDADGEAAFVFVFLRVCKYKPRTSETAGTRADSPFPAEGHGPRASADRAFFDRAVLGFAESAGNVVGLHVETTNVVEPAIVSFADERVGAGNVFIAGLRDCPVSDGRGSVKDAKGVGEDDGRFDLAEFVDLRGADEFAESVVDEDGAGDFVLKEIAGVRKDGSDAGADVVAFGESDLADKDARDIGDGVFGAGVVRAEGETEVAGAWPRVGGRHDGLLRGGRLNKEKSSDP